MTGADALAAVAVSIAIATALLGLVTVLAAIGWLFYVRHRTKLEAKGEVEKVAPEQIRAYLDANVPGMVAEIVAQLNSSSSSNRGIGLTSNEQAEALGEDPR